MNKNKIKIECLEKEKNKLNPDGKGVESIYT